MELELTEDQIVWEGPIGELLENDGLSDYADNIPDEEVIVIKKSAIEKV